MDSVTTGLRAPQDEDESRPDVQVYGRSLGGFSFDLHRRNAMLASKGIKPPKMLKTGTTIVGVIYKDGVVLGADTRATEDTTIADKNCEKIHHIAENIYCCGAGTAADTENITALIASQLRLMKKQTGNQVRVVTAMTRLKRKLFQYQGHISAALVLGGIDMTGPHLYTLFPHGSTDKLPFVTMGSGSLAAMAVLESGFKEDMSEAEARHLVTRAIRGGIYNDLASGSHVDLTILRRASAATSAAAAGAGGDAAGEGGDTWRGPVDVEILRNVDKGTEFEQADLHTRYARPATRRIPPGSTKVVKELFQRHIVVEEASARAGAGAGESKDDEMADD